MWIVAICYESIYGEYMSRFVNNGANLIGIITNDGWWEIHPAINNTSNMQDWEPLKPVAG